MVSKGHVEPRCDSVTELPNTVQATAVDGSARAIAAELIRQFLESRITNDELEEEWPKSSDPVLEEIRLAVWKTYDDESEHLGPLGGEELLLRCEAFLRTVEPYEWPVPSRWWRLCGALVGIASLGAHRLTRAGPPIDAPWPFREPP